VTNSFKEEPKIIRIYSEIITERDSQKVIILGKGGMKIKRLGTDSRKDLEKLFDKKVYLNLFVKSRKEWRNNDKMLNSMGYDAD
jgi:GTP-binding protein Era